jgi:serine/threonine protein kinase
MRWFVEGAKVAGKLRHDDLVPVLGGGRFEKNYYYVTLFMARGNAVARFRRASKEGIDLVKFALQTTIHMTRALEFGFQQKISHRGLRPTKILYDEDQQPKLNGLGFDNGPGPGLDMKSFAASFLAPEQIREPSRAGVSSDIYGLGACFYYMLTSTVVQRETSKQIRSPKLINRIVPESLCRIVEKMLEQDPARRYDNYGLLLHDLRWALRGEIWPRS